MSPHRPVAVAAVYSGQTYPCVGVQQLQWGLITWFRGWAVCGGSVWWSICCDSHAAALEQAHKLFDEHG